MQNLILFFLQIGTNHMNKNRARVELHKLYMGLAFIHMVCPNVYINIFSLSFLCCMRPSDRDVTPPESPIREIQVYSRKL